MSKISIEGLSFSYESKKILDGLEIVVGDPVVLSLVGTQRLAERRPFSRS